ncbi:MAG: polysaccharide biosynthesis/export family protein [Terracidiphilus sp.]
MALLLPAFFCFAQEKPPADQPAAQTTVATQTKSAASPTAQETAKQPLDDSYVIGELDSLSVVVWKEEGLTDKDVLVRPDGMISLALIGDIKASGKTPMQLAKEIEEQLKKYLQDPHVTITIHSMSSKRVYMMGEIGKTGPIMLTPGMTVLEAIATAGGLTEFANTKKIYILRVVDGKQQKIPVQYKQALKGDLSLNLTLKSGDTIVVP